MRNFKHNLITIYMSNCVIILLLFSSMGCMLLSVPTGMQLRVKRGRSFLIAESEKSYGWGVMSHPRLIQLSDRLLILQYYVGGDKVHRWFDPAGRKLRGIPPAVSTDGGKTWVFKGGGLDTNVLWHGHYWGYDVSTTNGVILGRGKTAIRVDENAKIIDGPWNVLYEEEKWGAGRPWHRLARMPNGSLIDSSYAERYSVNTNKRNRTYFLESKDNGKYWHKRGVIADGSTAPWGSEGPGESTIECLPDGTLICISRTGYPLDMSPYTLPHKRPTESMLLSRSTDGGETWVHTRMMQTGVYPRLLRMSNGVLVLGFGRPGNNLIFSTDNGATWGNELALTKADVRTSGYVDIAEVAPGKLFVVFDMFDSDQNGIWLWEPKEVNGVSGCFVDVKRLF